MLSVGLCVLVLLTATCPVLMAPSAAGAPARPDVDANRSQVMFVIPETMEPVCAELDDGTKPWATRHPREYQDWQDSVHGSAYLSGDTDVPGCTDCHDDPESGEIRSAAFRLESSFRCARCHGDEQLMGKHEIATDVYASYLADYHGLAVRYYRTHDRSMWRYEATCSDCHASHAIYRASDSRSSIAPANLLGTCRQCHPGAGANFTLTTSGHFRIDRNTSLLAYYIKLIYQILIPTFVGLMAAYIGLDIMYRLRKTLIRKE
jgi:5-methylcytosine-specific restriction endonuclease McrA